MRGAWIEMYHQATYEAVSKSLPMRGAWIEIVQQECGSQVDHVAPHAGSVD